MFIIIACYKEFLINMKLSFIISTLTSGGSERVVSILANEFSKKYQVDIILLVRKEIFYSIDSRVRVIDAGKQAPSLFSRMKWLRSHVKKEKYDVVIAFMTGVYCTTLFSLLGTNVPVIVSERIDPRVTPFLRKILRIILLPTATRLVVQTENIKKYYPRFIQNKTVIIYNPVVDEVFSDNKNNLVKCNQVVSVGRLFEQKNHQMLIKAFSMVHEKFPEYNLLIRGEGPLRQHLENLICKLNLSSFVFLPGRTADILSDLRRSKLFVLSSNDEGMSNAMIEAVCLGLPIVTTEVSGAQELIGSDGGYIVPINDTESLAGAIIRVLEDENKRDQMGLYNLKRAVLFKKEEIVKQWDTLLLEVVGVRG